MPSAAETVVVTGSTGTVASRLINLLAQAGVKVRAGVRKPADAEKLPDGVEAVPLDLEDPGSLQQAFIGADKLFLLTPFVQNQVELGTNAIKAAKHAEIKHIVRMSAMLADSEPGIQLTRQHFQIEQAVRDSGIAFTILRPNGFMQNYTTYQAGPIRTQAAFYEPLGDGAVSFVDARDIAAVAAAALTGVGHEDRVHEITGPEALSGQDIAATLSDVLGRTIAYYPITDEQAREAMHRSEMPGWMIESVLELYAVYRAGYAAVLSPAVENITGRKPAGFRQFAQDYAGAFQAARQQGGQT
jgi:uncharacterized protein YbjT (DUF2867 family)